MVEIDQVYAERVKMYVEGRIDSAMLIPDAIGGLDPRHERIYYKLQDSEYRAKIVDMIVAHIMHYNRIYDKSNFDYNTRVRHYMEHVYSHCNEQYIANLAVMYDTKLTEELTNSESRSR